MNQEETKLSAVKDLIINKLNILSKTLESKKADVLESRKEMWREARIVVRDFDDAADLSIFADDVAKLEAQYADASVEITKLGKMLGSPYFARIDFMEDGFEDVEEIYIGRHSLFDDRTRLFHVYDWRAPISGLYYDYGPGKASFTVPTTGTQINGSITLKRQYQIEKGELIYSFDNDIAIEDEILRRELSKVTEAHIKTIINTIQAEQNRAIRAESKDILVMGPAGSGKTSVGLHRLAYLLYRHRDKLSSKIVRIFSPGAIFSSYIEGIIPDLGEEDVLTVDFPTLLSKHSNRSFHGPVQQITHLTAEPSELRNIWLQKKLSSDFLDGLEKSIASHLPLFEDIFFVNDLIINKERLEPLYEDRTSKSNLMSKTERVLRVVNEAYNDYFKANTRQILEMFESIEDDDFSLNEARAKFDEERNISIEELKRRLLPPSIRIYDRYLKEKAREYSLPYSPAREALHAEKVYYEDALILFYVDILTGKVKSDKSVKHILVDEAQDLSILHHRILKAMHPSSAFTILADINQALYPEINIDESQTLIELYPTAKIFKLDKSYRSTVEIMNFANEILQKALPTAQKSDLFLRHGEKPAIYKTTDRITETIKVLDEIPVEFKSIGIILPTVRESKDFYKELKKVYATNIKKSDNQTVKTLRLLNEDTSNFGPGIMVVAAPLAKGLEFDAVISPYYNTPIFESPKGQRLLYLICTRALHRLYLLTT